MPQLIHNYIFCSKEVAEDIISIETFSKFNGRYDEMAIPLDKEGKRYLVIFDTRTDYPTEVIYEYFLRDNELRWLRVDEGETYEECFSAGYQGAVCNKRELVNGLNPKEICIRYTADNGVPIINLFISNTEIVIERYLVNEKVVIPLSKPQGRKILNYIEMLVSTTVPRRKGFYKYYLPTRRYLINELKIYWDGWHFEFVPTWNPDIKKNRVICGESLFDRLKKYIFPIIFGLYVENSIEETVIGILVGDGEMNRM